MFGISEAEAVTPIEHLCRERDAERVLNAPKSLLRPVDDVLFMSTLAVSEDPPYAAIKALGVNAANAHQGMETTGSTITLFDRQTAYPVAVMERRLDHRNPHGGVECGGGKVFRAKGFGDDCLYRRWCAGAQPPRRFPEEILYKTIS